ncbi:MAG: hypothetical protein HY298_20740 [Verrucomicrobia bacterium]|nr:hypothetical protein [Verrucomicrobiota bacterium]
MRGKFLHSKVMVATIVLALRLCGYPVRLEYPIRHGKHPRAVDIMFQANGRRVAMEIERTTARIPNDVAKAELLRADLFLIITPDARTARAAKAAVNRFTNRAPFSASPIRVMPFGAALQWVANNCPIMSTRNVTSDIKTLNPSTKPPAERKTS